jgi:RimJ/RimL family protein N-acetyltransferase
MDIVRLRSGREVAIRPIRADDGGRLEAAYARLSPDTRYRRFLAAKPRLTGPEVRYLTEVDGCDHFALIATLAADPEQLAGVGRFVRDASDSSAAEFAIVVSDPYQREGLGTELLQRLAEAALDRGITRFTATMLADNEAIHRLLHRLAGKFAEHRRNGSVDEVTIDLAA